MTIDRFSQDRLILVLGAPRSGTTLLTRILGSHSRVLARPEPHLLTPLAHLGVFDRVDRASYDAIQAAQAQQDFVSALPGGEADYAEALAGFIEDLYGRMVAPSNATHFLDKTPAYALVLPFLERVLPRARFVLLTRHPFAIWDSYAESFFDGDYEAAHDFNPILQRYVPAIGAFLRHASVPHLHLRYEELVSAPDAQVERLHAFLELPHEPETVDYGRFEAPAAGLGDPLEAAKQSRPVSSFVDKWAQSAGADPRKAAFLRATLDGLPEADLEAWGHPAAQLRRELDDLGTGSARPKGSGRFLLERRVLRALRKDVHKRPHGLLLQRVRRFCDVVLRGGPEGGWGDEAERSFGRVDAAPDPARAEAGSPRSGAAPEST